MIDYTYLLVSIYLCPGDWENKLERINMRADEDNGKYMGIGIISKVWWFSRNEYWNNIGCIVSDTTFGVGGYRLYEKDELKKISVKKRKISYIRGKVDFYDIC